MLWVSVTTEAGVFIPVSMNSMELTPPAPNRTDSDNVQSADLLDAAPSTGTALASNAVGSSNSFPLAGLDISLDSSNSPKLNRAAPDVSADVPVEPIPTPNAATAGLVVFGAWAGIRVIRRIRMA